MAETLNGASYSTATTGTRHMELRHSDMLQTEVTSADLSGSMSFNPDMSRAMLLEALRLELQTVREAVAEYPSDFPKGILNGLRRGS